MTRDRVAGARSVAIVFDLDGTLVDSRADIVAAARVALDAHNGPPRSDDEIASFVGDGARWLLARAFDLEASSQRLEPILTTFLDYYTAHPADRTTLLPGALSSLDALSGDALALCTNKPRVVTTRLLDALGLASRFDVLVAAGDLAENKPHPAPLLHIGEHLRMSPERLVMVGDGVQDIECGRAAGARTVAVLGGFTSRERLSAARPDAIIDDLHALPETIERFVARRGD